MQVTLSTPTTAYGAVSLGTRMAMTTIQESDGTLRVSVSGGGTVNEGADAVFAIELSGTVNQAITVSVDPEEDTEDNDNDPADNDYDDTNDTVTLEAGERSATFTVATKMDTIAERDETFKVTISGSGNSLADNGVVIGVAEASATIRDDDPLKVNLSGPKSVIQGTNEATYRLELDGGLGSADVEVTWREGQTTGAATIDAGEPSTTFTVNTLSRSVGDTVTVNLDSANTAAGRVSHDTSPVRTRITDQNTRHGVYYST